MEPGSGSASKLNGSSALVDIISRKREEGSYISIIEFQEIKAVSGRSPVVSLFTKDVIPQKQFRYTSSCVLQWLAMGAL